MKKYQNINTSQQIFFQHDFLSTLFFSMTTWITQEDFTILKISFNPTKICLQNISLYVRELKEVGKRFLWI